MENTEIISTLRDEAAIQEAHDLHLREWQEADLVAAAIGDPTYPHTVITTLLALCWVLGCECLGPTAPDLGRHVEILKKEYAVARP